MAETRQMRTRKEVESDIRWGVTIQGQPSCNESDVQRRILEVSLDIRDILKEIVARMEA